MKTSTEHKYSNEIKPAINGSQIWTSDELTNKIIDRIMWYTDNVMLSKFLSF